MLPPKELERNVTYFTLQDIEEAWSHLFGAAKSEIDMEATLGKKRYGKKLAEIRDTLEAIIDGMRKVLKQ